MLFLHVLLIIALYVYTHKIHSNRHLVLYVCMYVKLSHMNCLITEVDAMTIH